MKQLDLFREKYPGAIVVGLPSWLPDELIEDFTERGCLEYSFRFLKAERKVFRKRKPIPVSEWAENNRVVTMTALPGAWKNSVTPYLVGIMDSADYHSVREIAVCKGPQSGVTEATHNYIGYCIDRKPGPALYVFPDQLTAKENAVDRIIPMIERSSRLASYLTGKQDDKANLRINLQHMTIYLGWASSASRLANKPIRYAIADEIDKDGFRATAKETSPLNLIDKRLTTFRSQSKFFKISTPTLEDGNIWVALNESEVIFDYWVRCPECGRPQTMIFDRIKWEGRSKADTDELLKKRSARYSCKECDAMWDDNGRNKAVSLGEWRSRGKDISIERYLKSFNPAKIGFHLPSWITRFVSLSESAASFIRAQSNIDEMKDFLNSHKAEPYIPKHSKKNETAIFALKDEREFSIVPGDNRVSCLVAGIDTQKDGFWYEIRAFGWGLNSESWQIRGGFVKTFDDLVTVLWNSDYKDTSGNKYIVNLAVQDAMGHRTKEVYDFCSAYKGMILPFQGVQKMAQPYKFSKIEFYPGTNLAIPGGVQLLRANVNYYKNGLSRLLDISPNDPGAYHMASEMTDDWAKQMTSEYVDETGFWICPPGVANHVWDISVYGLIAYDVLGAKYWEKDIVEAPVEPTVKTKTKQRERVAKW